MFKWLKTIASSVNEDDVLENKEEQEALAKEPFFKRFYISVRQVIQPYWNPKPRELVEYEKNKNKKPSKTKETESVKEKSDKAYTPSGLKVFKVKKTLTKVFDQPRRPDKNTIWYYHDETHHQVLAHFDKNGRKRFGKNLRDDDERKKLKPLLYPRDEKYDRTHLFPFGYIGTENDPRLVVGWRAQHNRVDLAEFENRVSNCKEDVYWYVSIIKKKYGALLTARVILAESGHEFDFIQLKVGTATKPVDFYWRA